MWDIHVENGRPNFVCQFLRAGQIGFAHNDGEFFPAIPRDQVPGAFAERLQHGSHILQDSIAGNMPVIVIELFETIDVDKGE